MCGRITLFTNLNCGRKCIIQSRAIQVTQTECSLVNEYYIAEYNLQNCILNAETAAIIVCSDFGIFSVFLKMFGNVLQIAASKLETSFENNFCQTVYVKVRN